jgi:hypothetical protein
MSLRDVVDPPDRVVVEELTDRVEIAGAQRREKAPQQVLRVHRASHVTIARVFHELFDGQSDWSRTDPVG